MKLDQHVPLLDNEETWRYVWILFIVGALIFLALLIMCLRLWLILRGQHCVT